MKRRLLEILSSPCCGCELALSAKSEEREEILDGALVCARCGHSYPIRAGVPRLLEEPRQAGVKRTQESFAWEWNRYPGALPEDRALFLEETQIAPEAFKGKLVLDAGCGMGRYAKVALSLGAEVVAFDLSEACLRLAREASGPNLHVVQGNLHKPPFKPGSFDVIYSQGVLHHTSDTHTAFLKVAALVKAGGLLSVWLYGMAGRFADFATNPIRDDRKWIERHRRAAWGIVALRHAISDGLRAVTTRLPMKLTYALCYPITALGRVPLVKYFTFSVHPDFRVRLIENFDWLAPHYQYHHTKEELGAWFERAGFSVLKVLPHGLIPKPGVLGRKK